MASSNLPISRLVNATVNLAPNAAQTQNLSTLLILQNNEGIDAHERYRSYSSLTELSGDFLTSSDVYQAAQLYFAQSPSPTTLIVGLWAKTNKNARMNCGAMSTAQQELSNFYTISTGAFKITIDGTDHSFTGVNFAVESLSSMDAVAAIINAEVTSQNIFCQWNPRMNRFEFFDSFNMRSTISVLSAPSSGVDISGLINGTAALGAYAIAQLTAETPLTAVTILDDMVGQSWYALNIATAVVSTDDHLAVAGFIEASTNKHIYGISTNDADVISSTSTTDLAYIVAAGNYSRTIVQYSSSNNYVVNSLLARILTTNYNGSNTVITLMYKQEPTVVAERLSTSQINALESKNCNVFVAYNNNTNIIEKGVTANGTFLDIVTGTDWLSLVIQTAVYNLLYLSTTKIPQTDAGVHLLVTTVESICYQAVTNGLLAAGVWQSGGFGALNQNDLLPKGFYVYAPPVATQTVADRAARKSPTIQVAAKLAGAIHTVDILINVNR